MPKTKHISWWLLQKDCLKNKVNKIVFINKLKKIKYMKKDKFILNNNKCKCSYIARKPSYTSEFIACTSAAVFIVALLLIIPTNMKRMKTSESNSENVLLSECSGDGADVLSSKWYMEGVVQSISPSDSSINQCSSCFQRRKFRAPRGSPLCFCSPPN